jgi:hypothetical protein
MRMRRWTVYPRATVSVRSVRHRATVSLRSVRHRATAYIRPVRHSGARRSVGPLISPMLLAVAPSRAVQKRKPCAAVRPISAAVQRFRSTLLARCGPAGRTALSLSVFGNVVCTIHSTIAVDAHTCYSARTHARTQSRTHRHARAHARMHARAQRPLGPMGRSPGRAHFGVFGVYCDGVYGSASSSRAMPGLRRAAAGRLSGGAD